jgi:hypothetical protein
MTTSTLTFLLATILIIGAYGQSTKDEVKNTFHDYFNTVMQQENEKTLGYIYPKLFDIIPKEKMLDIMNKTKADTSTRVVLADPSITRISETTKIEATEYVVIQYTFKMTMTFSKSPEPDSEEEVDSEPEEDSDPIDFTYEMFKEKYGERNVKIDRESNTLEANISNEMFGIRDPSYEDWKFLEKKESMKPILEKLLPKKVLKM